MEFTRIVFIGDTPFIVVFDAERTKPAIMYGPNMRPAEGGEAEICEVYVEDSSYEIFELLSQSVRDQLYEKVKDLVAECFSDADDTAQADAAEARNAE